MSCEICCDDSIIIYGDELYQWDIDRQVVILGEQAVDQVHFSHCKDTGRAIVVEVQTNEDGETLAYVPNSLLTSSRDIYVWTWKDEHTIAGMAKLQVHARPRPDNYIYKPTDVITLESVIEWVKKFVVDFAEHNATDYEFLDNKPSIEGVMLIGDKAVSEFGIIPIADEKIDAIFGEGEVI